MKILDPKVTKVRMFLKLVTHQICDHNQLHGSPYGFCTHSRIQATTYRITRIIIVIKFESEIVCRNVLPTMPLIPIGLEF